jgi:hypothetical protein
MNPSRGTIVRRICPECGHPMPEDATREERAADPPRICSPLRCGAWRVIGRATPPDPITGAQTMLRLVDGEADR